MDGLAHIPDTLSLSFWAGFVTYALFCKYRGDDLTNSLKGNRAPSAACTFNDGFSRTHVVKLGIMFLFFGPNYFCRYLTCMIQAIGEMILMI